MAGPAEDTSLQRALATLECGQNPLVHSDQGFQYQRASWRKLLEGAGAVQSMSRKANCYDKAVMENFFGHLKERALSPRPIHQHRRAGSAADGIHPLVQHPQNLNKAQGSEPGGIPCSGPCSLGFYLARPTFGAQFSCGRWPDHWRLSNVPILLSLSFRLLIIPPPGSGRQGWFGRCGPRRPEVVSSFVGSSGGPFP